MWTCLFPFFFPSLTCRDSCTWHKNFSDKTLPELLSSIYSMKYFTLEVLRSRPKIKQGRCGALWGQSARIFRASKNVRGSNAYERGRASIIPAVAIYLRASAHNMPILIANMRTTLADKCVSFNETRVYLARWKASADGDPKRNRYFVITSLRSFFFFFSLVSYLALVHARCASMCVRIL